MTAKVLTVSFIGIEVKEVEVQVQIVPGLPAVSVVGLPDKTVGESRERIKAAFHAMGLGFPQRRVIINLAPADLLKEGSHYDLAIALGVLLELRVLRQQDLDGYYVLGELSLDGTVNQVNGILPAAIGANASSKGIVCPIANGNEAAWSGNPDILATRSLVELINHFKTEQVLKQPVLEVTNIQPNYLDMKDIKGQKFAKRALEIAAAGGHHMLMSGPPGAGKSMLAKRLPGLLPKLTTKEILEISIIASIAGQLNGKNIMNIRPFRDPHNSASMPSIIGGGRTAKPGEVTLAHLGVLFLDELPEFPRNLLESLRQPVEAGTITIARVNSHVTYPARFQLIAAMNPCRCGHFGDINNSCTRAPGCAQEYQSRISGPLFDRFDLRVEMQAIRAFEIEEANTETSATVAGRVKVARDIQASRYQNTDISLNSHADGELLYNHTQLDDGGNELLKSAMEKFSLSMRGYNRILRVARTIADLDNCKKVLQKHIAEALSFRLIRIRA